jgi:hypothetical protein
MMLENAPADQLPEDLEELASLEGVRKYPVRIKCALLAWNTLLEGLKEYEEKKGRGRARSIGGTMSVTVEQVRGVLKTIYDPEIHLSIADLGLIYGVEVTPDGQGERQSGCADDPHHPGLSIRPRPAQQSSRRSGSDSRSL